MISARARLRDLAHSEWELRHGKRIIAAKIEDKGWLKRFSNLVKSMFVLVTP